MKPTLYILVIFLSLNLKMMSQPFDCDGTFFMSYGTSAFSNTKLINIYYDEGEEKFKWNVIQEGDDRQIGPIGFRVIDNLIYGLDQKSMELVTIDAGGKVSVVGDLSATLDTNYRYYAGDITALGKYFVLIGRDRETQIDEQLFFVRLDREDLLTGRLAIISQQDMRFGDIVSSPIYDAMYGFDSLNRKLADIRWNTGLVTNYSYQSTPNLTASNAMFADREGNLFAFGSRAINNPTDDTFYEMNIFNGEATVVGPGPRSRIVDGCSCPYTITLKKEVRPEVALPCQDIQLVYSFNNKAGTSYRNVDLKDSLSEEFTIIGIDNLPDNAIINSGLGSNKLDIQLFDLLLGTDSIIVTVAISPDAQGEFASQASLGPLPMAFDGMVYSDNPKTDSSDQDVSTIKIGGDFDLGENMTICDEIPIVLGGSLPSDNDEISYRWNTGSTESSILVSDRGWYWVDVEFGCATYRDSIFIEKPPFFSTVDAGPDQEILQGFSIDLQGSVNASGNYELIWTSQPLTDLSCIDCLEPVTTPLDSTLFTLTLTDEYGCQIQDEAWVYVDKVRDIFISNVFSPNDDGINDVFFISGTSIAEIRTFHIFDRWGRKTFASPQVSINSREYGWDGRMGRQNVSPGVYYYAVELVFPDQTTQIYKGSITLLR